MDEFLTRDADSRIPGSAAVLGKGSNPFEIRDRIPRFHTDFTQKNRSGLCTQRRPINQTTHKYRCIHTLVTPRQTTLPIRHLFFWDRFCVFVRNHRVFWVGGFLVFRMVDRLVRS